MSTKTTRSVSGRGALAALFLVVLVDLMGFGIVLPLLAYYGARTGAPPAAIGALYSSYSLAQLVFSPLWGALSDRIGRKPVMLISTLGAALAYTLLAFAGSFWTLLVSRLLAGVMGGNISAAQAYVADVTTEKDRSKGMGLIGAAFGIGFVMGPALAALLTHPAFGERLSVVWPTLGAWVSRHTYHLPGLAAAALSALSFALVVLKLPEPPRNPAGSPSRIMRPSIFKSAFWAPLVPEGPLRALLLSALILAVGHSTLYSAFPIFCQRVLDLGPHRIGMQFAWMGLVSAFIQGGLLRVLVKRCDERRLFIIGSAIFAAALLVIPLSRTESQLTAALCLLAVGGSLNGPTLTSLLSKQSDERSYGLTLGTAQSMSALGRVIGPVWGGVLAGIGPAVPFVLTGIGMVSLVGLGRAQNSSPSRS